MFKVKLISIKEKILPELDDEFAKDVSEFETLEEYKKDVEKKVKEQKENQAKAEVESKAIEKLLENTEVEIPVSMIDDEVEKMLQEFSANLSYQGLDLDTYYVNTTVDEFKKTLRPNADKDVKLQLALEAVVKQENLEVTEEEIKEKVEELAKQYGSDNADTLMKNENVIKYMKEKLLQDKALAVVTESVVEK